MQAASGQTWCAQQPACWQLSVDLGTSCPCLCIWRCVDLSAIFASFTLDVLDEACMACHVKHLQGSVSNTYHTLHMTIEWP